MCLESSSSTKMWTEIYLAFGIQLIGWLFAVIFQTEKFYDLTGSLTFLAIISHVLWTRRITWLMAGHLVQMACVLVWTIRLGSFLFRRVLKAGEDRRFRQIKTKPIYFLFVWGMQGIWVTMSLLPSLLMWKNRVQPTISTIQIIGWSIWIIGFVLETLADYQKSQFRSKPENKDKFIQTGLWSISRHPNYFGEILLWFGLYLAAMSSFSGLDHLSIVGPIFNALLIIRISGIPLLEAHADKKWASDIDYQKYKARTSILIPYL